MSTYPEQFKALEEENKKLRKALRLIAAYETPKSGQDEGICPYGCDCPGIAKDTLHSLS